MLGRAATQKGELSLSLPVRVEQRGQATHKPSSSYFHNAQYGVFKFCTTNIPKNQDSQRKSKSTLESIFTSKFFMDVGGSLVMTK